MYRDIKLTEEEKNELFNSLKDDIINDTRIQPYLQIARVVGSENSDANYSDTSTKGLLTFYKYELYDAIIKDTKNSLNDITLGLIKSDYPILMFNIDEWLYENMELIENEDVIEELAKAFYLIHKYKGTPFSDDVLQYFKDIENITNIEKPEVREDTKDMQEMSKLNRWYQFQLYNLLFKDIFYKYAKGHPYHKDDLKERAISCFRDKDFKLSLYYTLLQAGETKEKIIDFIHNCFKNSVSHSETLYKFRQYLNLHVLDMSKKHSIDIKLTEEEQKEVKIKIQNIKEFIYNIDTDKYTYSDLIENFFKISDIYKYLSFDEKDKIYLKLEEQKEVQKSDKRVTKTAQKSSNTTTKKPKRDYKALREKYKDVTRLTEPLDYNRKWAKLDNSKENTNIMSIREQIQNYKRSDEDKINKEIYDLQSLNTLTKEQKEKLEELIEDKKELLEEKKEQQQKLDNIKDEIRLLNETLEQASDITETRRLKRFLKQKETEKESLEKALSNNGVAFQQNLLTGNLEYKQESKRKHESTTIVIPQDYDISQFNQESRNFLYYIPNIPNIMDELEKDFITIDISDYLSFTGRETGNVSRIRKKLFNSLKEMKKESYEFSYRGSKGELIEGSLSIIGDIITTEYKGKATVSVHLEPTYKNNIRRAFNTNQIANINKEVFKLGQGSTNKIEKITKEIAIYLTRLARNDAKNGLKNGKWVKDIHIKTLIDYLVSINLIDYDTRYYSRYVKEPLQDALNLGKDLNLFDYKTNAFEYYDNSISKSMNWTRDKEHIAEFESGKDNGVHIILNADNIADLEKNQKANTTYKKYQKKYDKKTTK